MFARNYAGYYGLFNRDKPYKKDCNFIYRWAEKPDSILDIGCGTASYWKYFPGDIVIAGIEKSLEMINRAKEPNIYHADVMEKVGSVGMDFDCVTALFDVINYIPGHSWWQDMSLRKGGYFIFDVWDKKKVDAGGFEQTIKGVGGMLRIINPLSYDGKEVKLNVTVCNRHFEDVELHKMYVYSEADLKRFCGRKFKIVDKKETRTWQTWYKLRRI